MSAGTIEHVPIRAIQKAGEDDAHVGHLDGITRIGDNVAVAEALAGGKVDVVAGTQWLLARPEFDDAFDGTPPEASMRCPKMS